jgi:hypothetical protein
MSHAIDRALSLVEQLGQARAVSIERKIAAANSLLFGARLGASPDRREARRAIALRLMRSAGASFMDRRVQSSLREADHARLAAELTALYARIGEPLPDGS